MNELDLVMIGTGGAAMAAGIEAREAVSGPATHSRPPLRAEGRARPRGTTT